MNLISKFSKILSSFRKRPGKPKSKPGAVITTTAPVTPEPKPAKTPDRPTPQPAPPKPTNGQKLLDDISAFLARYLQCSEHQRTVLALWILHTHCFAAARITPYLAVHSFKKQSGKTLCLHLLSLLCSNPALTSGFTAAALVNCIHSHPHELPTFLLDESVATLGSRSRSKSPKLRAILLSGSVQGIGYTDRAGERVIFSPKAFAAMGKLPEALADRSLPIILAPLGASDKTERFDPNRAREEAKPILAAVKAWSKKNLVALQSVRPYKRKDFPEQLSFRRQDLIEPLLHLADTLAGECPARARTALVAIFEDELQQDREIRLQLLRDIRQCFERHDWPKGLHTRVLLPWLQALPARPWDVDGPITDRIVASLLHPYGISPMPVRIGSVARGYRQKDFVDLWHNLLDASSQSQKPNNDAGCNAVTPAPKPVPSAAQKAQQPGSAACTRVGAGVSGGVGEGVGVGVGEGVGLRACVGRDRVGTPSPAKAVTPTSQSQKPNNDAACNAVTSEKIDPRVIGILDDPRNFNRQYPDDHRAEIAKLVDEHCWPLPADVPWHGGPLLVVPNHHIPTSIINLPPWDRNSHPPRGVPLRTPRHPVTLDREERIQVGLARLYEICANQDAERKREPAKQAG